MDEQKVQVIVDLPVSSKVTELISFLRLANYYRQFIEYLKKVSPLMDLLNKDINWTWFESYEKAFEDVKQVITFEPILRLLDFSFPFEI